MADNWSDEELEIALIAYFEMVAVGDINQYNRSAFYRALSEKYSDGRKSSAYRKRMENYSSLLKDLKRSIVPEIGFQDHLGPAVRNRLEPILERIDGAYELFEKIHAIRLLLKDCKK